jgi:hypothetical protein
MRCDYSFYADNDWRFEHEEAVSPVTLRGAYRLCGSCVRQNCQRTGGGSPGYLNACTYPKADADTFAFAKA